MFVLLYVNYSFQNLKFIHFTLFIGHILSFSIAPCACIYFLKHLHDPMYICFHNVRLCKCTLWCITFIFIKLTVIFNDNGRCNKFILLQTWCFMGEWMNEHYTQHHYTQHPWAWNIIIGVISWVHPQLGYQKGMSN